MSAELTSNPSERQYHEYYSPERKAEVLALIEANDGNLKRTAAEVNINPETIRYWIQNKERFAELQPHKQEDLATQFESDANNYLAIARTKADQASFSQLMTGAAIAVDKMLILRQQPTQIVQHIDSSNLTVILQQVLNEITSVESTD